MNKQYSFIRKNPHIQSLPCPRLRREASQQAGANILALKGLFITGTDTGVGKTLITGLLGRYLREKNYPAITQKWIQTGVKKNLNDIDGHLKLMNINRQAIKQYLPYLNSYAFKLASSPHLASRCENKTISKNKIIQDFNMLSKVFNPIIVEGIGGALVPYNNKNFVIDLTKQLKLPVIIVCQNKLGAINYALLTIEALRRRNIKIIGIIFNAACCPQDEKIILRDNPQIIKKIGKIEILGNLYFSRNVNFLYQQFKPIGEKIINIIKKEGKVYA